MARLPRLNLPDIPQHVVQRGNNRQVCFFSDQDYVVYLDRLKHYSRKYKVAIHAYVLMTNHVHLLMTPSDEKGVSRLIQALSSAYVRYINMTYGRTGTLWEGRFKSSLVDSENYFLVVSRYIELNPVRAQMVSHPSEYPWSSYRKNALGIPIKLITPHWCYHQLGKNDEERILTYQSLFKDRIPDFTLAEIRDSINKTWVLGDSKFKSQIEEQTGRRASPLPKGGDRKSEEYKS
ncbi:transposase [Marinicella meishanensis]|uniref:transposase n=1 Tax=Marinicella meishanensis TaxID=2873263 RepID=UPI001CBD04AA|nr:transposase [Marinicella sp. NBU2979]